MSVLAQLCAATVSKAIGEAFGLDLGESERLDCYDGLRFLRGQPPTSVKAQRDRRR